MTNKFRYVVCFSEVTTDGEEPATTNSMVEVEFLPGVKVPELIEMSHLGIGP